MFKNNSILAVLIFSTFGILEYITLGFEITVLTLLICILTGLYSVSVEKNITVTRRAKKVSKSGLSIQTRNRGY